jgi:hypothetical protein
MIGWRNLKDIPGKLAKYIGRNSLGRVEKLKG